MDAKWDSVSLNSMEFAILTKQHLFFYRLSHRRSLEYIQVADPVTVQHQE
jgi:hypothetical protein